MSHESQQSHENDPQKADPGESRTKPFRLLRSFLSKIGLSKEEPKPLTQGEKDVLIRRIEEIIEAATSEYDLNAITGPGGLFSQLAPTREERQKIVESELFQRLLAKGDELAEIELQRLKEELREDVDTSHLTQYEDCRGNTISLEELDIEEKELVADLQRKAGECPNGGSFASYWMRTVARFYDNRSVPRNESQGTVVFRIAQDLNERLDRERESGPPDYRTDLGAIVYAEFGTQQAFSQATELPEDKLNRVLARREHLSIEELVEALGRIGYGIRLMRRQSFKPADHSE